MENPASISKPQEKEEEAPATLDVVPSEEIKVEAPQIKKKGMAARLFEAEAEVAEAEPSSESSSEPAPEPRALRSRASKGFATLESAPQQQPAEKKSYMQIMKEKSLYQAQQFESTMEVETKETKPAPKPAALKAVAKSAASQVAVKSAGKPAGVKPPQKLYVPEPVDEEEAISPPPEFPEELPELPDLPSLEVEPGEATTPMPLVTTMPSETEEPEAPVMRPVQKPAGMKPLIRPPVQKPAGMKPPVGPPVQKPAGMKPPIKPPIQKPAGMKPPIKPPSQFQSVEPATRAAPFPAAQAPAVPQGSRLDQLKQALTIVLNSLAWPDEKKDALMQELMSLPDDQQTDFLEQLGVEVPAPAPTAQPVPQVPVAVPASMIPSMPDMQETYETPPFETVAPVTPMKMPAKPPVKPAGMKPVKPAGIKPVKPSIAPLVAPAGFTVAPPVMKPIKPAKAAKPAIVPPVVPPEEFIAPPVTQLVKPAAQPAGTFFESIDQEIEKTVGGEFELGKFLDADLAKIEEIEKPVVTKRGKGKVSKKKAKSMEEVPAAPVPPVAYAEEVPAAPEAAPPSGQKLPIKLSQISTKVEKKTAAELKKEEEKLKSLETSESSLVYMRLLGFEKLASVGKTYKLGDFCKTLKDIEPNVVIDFIKAVDNDMLIAFEENKGQVVVSDLSGPELEIMSRQFEKWLRFGRL